MATQQLSLKLRKPPKQPTRGGARPGAGRPRLHALPEGWRPGRRFVPHLQREAIDRHTPAHVTLRFRRVARTLRNGKLHASVASALRACMKSTFQVVHYSLQDDHMHLVVEAHDRRALARGMQGLGIRLARGINRKLERSGHVLADRYHARMLTTPTAVRNAILYVLNNARHHAAEQNATYPRRWLDPYSSAESFDGWVSGTPPSAAPLAQAGSWLLRVGWRRKGLLEDAAVPGGTAAPGFDDR